MTMRTSGTEERSRSAVEHPYEAPIARANHAGGKERAILERGADHLRLFGTGGEEDHVGRVVQHWIGEGDALGNRRRRGVYRDDRPKDFLQCGRSGKERPGVAVDPDAEQDQVEARQLAAAEAEHLAESA